jgi:hypothetical protein
MIAFRVLKLLLFLRTPLGSGVSLKSKFRSEGAKREVTDAAADELASELVVGEVDVEALVSDEGDSVNSGGVRVIECLESRESGRR